MVLGNTEDVRGREMKEQIIEKDGKQYKVVEIIEDPNAKLYFGKYTMANIQDALQDTDWNIRLEAYRALGYTKEALNEDDEDIRREAQLFFEIQDSLKQLEDTEK